MQNSPKDFDTPVEFRVNFSALDAGDTNTSTLDYLSLDRISPVLDVLQPDHAVAQVCKITHIRTHQININLSKYYVCFTQHTYIHTYIYTTTRLNKYECTVDQVLYVAHTG